MKMRCPVKPCGPRGIFLLFIAVLLLQEELFGHGQIFRSVYGHPHSGSLHDTYPASVFEETQAFYLFGCLKFPHGPSGKHFQSLSAECVDTDMAPVPGSGMRVAGVGQGLPGEIEGISVCIRDYLDIVGIGYLFLGCHQFLEGTQVDILPSFFQKWLQDTGYDVPAG